MSLNETTKFINFDIDKEEEVKNILSRVYKALQVKGYDPVNQIVGYVLSGDPTYITSYNNARYRICSLQRDELVEELVRFYIQAQDAAAAINGDGADKR